MRFAPRALVVSGAIGAFAGTAAGQERPLLEWSVRYDGHRAVRVTVQTPRQLATVLALTDDVLTCHGAGIGSFDVRFTPEQYAVFAASEIEHQVLIDDLQAHLEAWRAENRRMQEQDSGWYEAFRSLGEIEQRLADLAAAHPELATISVIGQTVEGRPIWMIRITGPGATDRRPAMVINGTQHAREALSPMTAMYFADFLLDRYASDPSIQSLVNGFDFFIIPVLNADGYAYAWTSDPMWRKNRRVNSGTTCRGVDPNRNWGYQWGQAGAGTAACGEIFMGAGPFSEPENQAVAAVIEALSHEGRLRIHLDLHGSLQRLYSTWAFTTRPPADLPLMQHLGALMRDAIATHRGRIYQFGAGAVLNSYHYAGNAADYSYGNFGSMSWTIEPAGGTFYPPTNQIIPVGEEVSLGFAALAEFFLPTAGAGACCISSGCHQTGAARCAQMAGRFHGPGSDCAEVQCPLRMATVSPSVYAGPPQVGVFLNVTAHARAITLTGLECYSGLNAGTPTWFDVYTYPGSYILRDSTSAGWVLQERFEVLAPGPGVPIPLELSSPRPLSTGETIGIYVIAGGGSVGAISTGFQPSWPGTNISLYSNLSRSAPWGGVPTSAYFSGSVHYVPTGVPCYPNCDLSAIPPVLNVADFACFLQRFATGSPYANCDQSTSPPVLDVADFACFLQKFAAGCQ
jgi:murein tripeptide amidase MpaA